MRMPALALKRKQWEPFAFASPAVLLLALVIVFPRLSQLDQLQPARATEK